MIVFGCCQIVLTIITAQKMKFSIKDFLVKCDQHSNIQVSKSLKISELWTYLITKILIYLTP